MPRTSYGSPVLQATATPSGDNQAVDANLQGATDFADRADTISGFRDHDTDIDATVGNMQHSDAQRIFPRARTDNINPESGRGLTPAGETVQRPSIFSHRRNRRNSNAGISKFNTAQDRTVKAFLNPQNADESAVRNELNTLLESGVSPDDLTPGTRRYMRWMDSAIQKVERENDRTHVVYASLNLGDDVPVGWKSYAAAMKRSAKNGGTQTLLGYTRANHDPNAIPDDGGDNVLFQIETNRGMYVGGNGNSGHVLPRGVELEYVSHGEFDVDDGQGGTARRRIVQMREVPQDERTVART